MAGNNTIYQVDSFTDKLFRGNPAGVMIIDDPLSEDEMQNIAMEMNLSETAFVYSEGEHFNIRYFTPEAEVPLCGHATLASAHIMYETGLVKNDASIFFKAKGGELNISRKNDLIVMNFPAYSLHKTEIPEQFETVVGFRPLEIYKSDYDWIVAVAESDRDISEASPDFTALKKYGMGHLMITAKNSSGESDFVVRCFAPALGINEDPVTGSAHCALTPLWYRKIGKPRMKSIQLSKRTGSMLIEMKNDRVLLMGKAVTVFKIMYMFS